MHFDAIILGAGASGLMAAITAGKANKKVLVIDCAKKPGQKLLISGGGKCNVTNTHVAITDFFGTNTEFCKNALQNFTPKIILKILQQAKIEIEEREYGRIFCKKNATDLVSFLVSEAEKVNVTFFLNNIISDVFYEEGIFLVQSNNNIYKAPHLLVATGGIAYPAIGATDFGYKLAKQFGHKIIPLKPALSSFVLPQNSPLRNLQGISLDVETYIKGKRNSITEPLLFTHKGLSGPSMLQISCFWEKGDSIIINFLPHKNANSLMHEPLNGKLLVKNLFSRFLPERLILSIISNELLHRKVAELNKKERISISENIHCFSVVPSSTEGFIKAEATLGGVSTNEINAHTMESLIQPGLFFSGEVMDITGKLGGYNIHWAFASGYAAGQFL